MDKKEDQNSQKPNLYYQEPTDKVFQEVKAAAIKLWKTYEDSPRYVEKKVGGIKDMGNIRDNFMYMVCMFDYRNRSKLMSMLSEEAKKAINERIRAGGENPILYFQAHYLW